MYKSLNKHLEYIRVEGFRSIKEMDMEMRPINILIGANGAGKSNFISLFTFIKHLSKGKLQNYIAREGGARNLLHFGAKNTRDITIDLEIDIVQYHVKLISDTSQDLLIFEEESITLGPDKWDLKHTNKESGLSIIPLTGNIVMDERTKEYLDQCRVYHFVDTDSYAGYKAANKLANHHYLEQDAANIAPFLYYLKSSDIDEYRISYYQIVSAIKAVAPFFHDFYLYPDGVAGNEHITLRWEHAQYDNPLSANMLSDGTARFICLATLLHQPESLMPKTIVLDEPELGLHPDALAVLAEMIQQLARKTQIIISTQSVEFSNRFEPEDFIVVEENKGASIFKRLDRVPLETWLEEYGIGDIWTKNLIGGNPP